MATFLLDTSVIIDAINDRKGRRQLLRNLINQGNTLACSPINIAEVYAGLRPPEEQNTKHFLQSLDLYPVTWPVAELAGLLKRDYGKKGKTLAITDTIIAAVALHYQLQLITDNIKDFPMPDLAIYPLPD